MYLIDMAVAEQSAYWELRPGNERKLAEARVENMRQRQRPWRCKKPCFSRFDF